VATADAAASRISSGKMPGKLGKIRRRKAEQGGGAFCLKQTSKL